MAKPTTPPTALEAELLTAQLRVDAAAVEYKAASDARDLLVVEWCENTTAPTGRRLGQLLGVAQRRARMIRGRALAEEAARQRAVARAAG